MNNLIEKIQNALDQQHDHNNKTQNNINQINQLLSTAPSFDHVLHQLRQYPKQMSLEIHNYTFWIMIAIAVLCFIFAIGVHPYFFIFTILTACFAFYKRTSTKALKQLISHLEDKNLEHKYQIRFFADEQDKYLPSPYQFPLFSLGDHENDIRNTIYGTWTINQINYPYMLFNYHYVDEVETRDSDGDSKTEYRHYDLWGILLSHFPTQGISISSKQRRACRLGVKWSSGDIRFDQRYQLSGLDEMRLAKFFSPSHVLLLEQAMDYFQGDFYVHPAHPTLCWLFKKEITRIEFDVSSVKTVGDLIERLDSMHMPDYEQLKQSLHHILEEIQPHYQPSNSI